MRINIEGDALVQSWIESSSEFYKVDPNLVRATIKKESSWNPRGKNLNDPSYGLGGVTPMLAQDYGIVVDYQKVTAEEIKHIYDPETNIDIVAWNYSRLNAYPLDEKIQMYNMGEQAYLDGYRVPDYLAKVLEFYNEYSAR